MNPKMD